MGRIKFSVHPLFFVVGFYFALTGKIIIFVIYTLTAFIHEMGHSISAYKRGYTLNHITLMPFGAVVKGDIDGLKFLDQLAVALSGPTVNFLIALFFVAIWWVYPLSYCFTDIIVEANLSLCLINLLPAYPLDGGRVLFFLVANNWGRKFANRLVNIITIIISACLFGLFFYSLKKQVNISLLLFALFVIMGLKKYEDNRYVKVFCGVDDRELRRGIEIKKLAISCESSVKSLFLALDMDKLNQVEIYDGKKKMATLSQNQLENLMQNKNIYGKIRELLK